MRQTEQAVFDISELFVNIAGRARTQLARAAETIRRSDAVLEKVAPASAPGSAPREQESSGELLKIKDETAALTSDIHGVIAALQFEEIVRQQIALAITELQRLRQELLKNGTSPRSFGPARIPRGVEVFEQCLREVTRGAYHEKDVFDRG
jgi:hypothetical protein